MNNKLRKLNQTKQNQHTWMYSFNTFLVPKKMNTIKILNKNPALIIYLSSFYVCRQAT